MMENQSAMGLDDRVVVREDADDVGSAFDSPSQGSNHRLSAGEL